MHNHHADALLAKLPDLDQAALLNLQQNARRVGQVGSAKQREDAGVLLLAVEQELGARLAARAVQAAERQQNARERRAKRGTGSTRAAAKDGG